MTGQPINRDKTLRRFVGYRMKRAFNVMQADLVLVLKPFGLRMMTFSALSVVVDNPGLRQSQLAEILSIERPNLVAILDELQSAGLIRRDPVAEDRRAHALVPTAEGVALCAKASDAILTGEDRRLSGLSPEQRQTALDVMGWIEASTRETR